MRSIPHRLSYLNTWSPVNNTVWEGIASAKELCHRGRALSIYSLVPLLVLSSVGKNVVPQLPVPTAIAFPAV